MKQKHFLRGIKFCLEICCNKVSDEQCRFLIAEMNDKTKWTNAIFYMDFETRFIHYKTKKGGK